MNTDKPDAVELTRIGRAHFDANGNYLNSVQVMQIEFENQIDQLTAENDRLKKEVEAATEQLREFAEDVAYQYAYERAGCLTTGGLSTMETTFNILGWDDPHKLGELK